MQKLFAQSLDIEKEKERSIAKAKARRDGVKDDPTLTPPDKAAPLAGDQLQTRMRKLINQIKAKYGIPRTGAKKKKPAPEKPEKPEKPAIGDPEEAFDRDIRGLESILEHRHWSLPEKD